MLELKNIVKNYYIGDTKTEALRGLSLSFRRSEFVSILGPSGCGKTTLLNIIGGLDRYTSGDLIINGKSTKDFKDRDWDAYRNHSVGFVFQSYNLIPHQSVLSNVELALTLSGVSKNERRKRAKEALEMVGLGDQLSKKPGQMSGGQMQRVAIARALVNDPDILLADEPTGALDSVTSVQIMEILKKVSEKRLVVMVTHNPELAEQYSTRIVRLRDGVMVSDSSPYNGDAPYSKEEKSAEKAEEKGAKKAKNKKNKRAEHPSMSFWTALSLSFNNLMTKRARTVLTSFAGSIGIIGIALILAISQGMTTYIDAVQESTLSSYPITLEATTVELSSLMQAFMNISAENTEHENDAVYKKAALYNMLNALNSIEESENDLKSFKEYIESELKKTDSPLSTAINGVQYAYNLDMHIYTKNVDGKVIRVDTEEILMDLMLQYIGIDMSAMSSMAQMSPMGSSMSMASSLWQELLPANDGGPINDLLYDQYELAHGVWPKEYNEIVLVLDKNNELDDVTLYALGLLSESDMDKLADAALNGTKLELEEVKWSYEEICNREYRTVLNSQCYISNGDGTYTDLREQENGLDILYNKNSIPLKVTGIIRPREDADNTMLTGSICYTNKLTKYVIEKAHSSDIVNAQLGELHTDIITGLPFKSNTGSLTVAEKAAELRAYMDSLSDSGKMALYTKIRCIIPEEMLKAQLEGALAVATPDQMKAEIAKAYSSQMSVNEEEIKEYLDSLSEEDLKEVYSQLVTMMLKAQYAQAEAAKLAQTAPEVLAGEFARDYSSYTEAQLAFYYGEVMTFSESTYEDNLIMLGYLDISSPSAINIYASSFENKDIITDAIAEYNKSVSDEMKQIKYTDYIGLMMSSITTIINAITYVLIAFVAISLIVSSIMIGVITLISVQERTKEIGILRAIGASKRDVSGMFNAETMIVGFSSGMLGVIVTYILCIPINMILYALTDIANLKTHFPWQAALILIAISVLLTLISGIIPSRSAARKDPVVALRTE